MHQNNTMQKTTPTMHQNPPQNLFIQFLQQIKTIIIHILVKLYEQYFKYRNPLLYQQMKKNFEEKQQEQQIKREEHQKQRQEIKQQTQQTIQFATKNQNYINKMKDKFQKSFETTKQNTTNWNENISPIFYSTEYKTIDFYIMDKHPELIEQWTAKQLMRMYWNDIQSTNVIMNYLPEKNKFNVYSSVDIKSDFLNAMAMEYVLLFRCRGFFGDLTQVPEEYHNQYIANIDDTNKTQKLPPLTLQQQQQREKLEKLFVKKKERKTDNLTLRKNIFCQNKITDWEPLRIKKEFIDVSVRDENQVVHTMIVPKTTKYRDFKHKIIMEQKAGIIDYKEISVPDYETKHNAYYSKNSFEPIPSNIPSNIPTNNLFATINPQPSSQQTKSNFFATSKLPHPQTPLPTSIDEEDTETDDASTTTTTSEE